MRFWFILPGWERSAYNSKIFKDAIVGKRFIVSEEKYWLANTEYSNSNYL